MARKPEETAAPRRPATALGSRRLLARVRAKLATGAVALPDIVALIAAELVAEVCSAYTMRGGELLELRATHGLDPAAIGRTRLRIGEGIVGLAAATGTTLNLADAQNHPAFAYRPETREEPFASMLAVPVRRGGQTLGVLAVQNRNPRHYTEDEVETVETVAMLLSETLVAEAVAAGLQGFSGTLPRQFDAAILAPGLVLGPVVLTQSGRTPRRLVGDDPEAERKRLETALASMRRELDALIDATLPDGDAPRDILDATRDIAAGEGWLRRIDEAIRTGLSAEAAVHRVAADMRDRMRRVADPYLRERLADLEDLAERLLVALEGRPAPPAEAAGAILVARRLGPAQLLEWHTRGIAAVAIEEGSPGGHAAILARALGLPALGAMRDLAEAASQGDEAVLDAENGTLILRPDPSVRHAFLGALEARAARAAGRVRLRDAPSLTRDGTGFRLMLNAGLTLELDQLAETGAEGIGLFRTEIAMLARGAIADAEEQTRLYRAVLDAAGPAPVHFRTLDLGSDKLLADAAAPPEENPAMGWRSLRVGLDRPAILRRQLRALLAAAAGRPLSVMFPMVATLAEFRQARALLDAEAARAETPPASLRIGTMLEIPALLWDLPALLAEADFVSIGSNDLLQFVFAADRGTATLADRYDFLSPPMLAILEKVAAAAANTTCALSLCGEAAGRPLDAAVLVALGITTLSMSATSVLAVKETLRALDLGAFRPFLETLRRTGTKQGSFRDPISAWAREHGVPT